MTTAQRINAELDREGMAYRLRDREGNEFVYAGLESGFPVYRGQRGSKHIFDTDGYEIVEERAAEEDFLPW